MRLLLVDDRPEDRELIVRRLRQKIEPLELTEAANAAAFQAALHQGPFDLVVTDYQLCWSDGLQVLREIKRQFPATPVVMCTDSGNEQVVAEGMRIGLSDYVLKQHLERLPTAAMSSIERAELQRRYEEAAHELQLSEQRYRTIAGQIADLAYTLRVAADGTVAPEWMGGRFFELSGYSYAELEARKWASFIYPEDTPIILEHIAELLTGRAAEAELRILTRQGDTRWLHISAQPEMDSAGGQVIRIYGGAQDITARRQAEEQVRRARDELEVRVQERTAELKQANDSLLRQAKELQELAGQLQQQNQRLDDLNRLNEGLNRINALLSATFDVKTVAQEILVQSVYALEAEAAALTWCEGDGWLTTDVYGLPKEVCRRYAGEEAMPMAWVAQHRELLIADDVLTDPRFPHKQECPYALCAAVFVPLTLQEQVLAVMTLSYRSSSRRFGHTQVDFCRKMAASLALALENERLHRQAQQDAETRAVLLREVNHRVKNNLTAIVGLLYTQLSRSDLAALPEFQTAILDLTRRVEGLAVAHTMLSTSQWTPLALDELAKRVLDSTLQAVPTGQLKIEIIPSHVRVSPDQAHTLALIVNELALNVGKHALKTGGPVHISVCATREDDWTVLVFRDSGPGYPQPVIAGQQSGVGIDLLRNLVSRNLHGQVQLRNEGGAVTEIRFPPLQKTTDKEERTD